MASCAATQSLPVIDGHLAMPDGTPEDFLGWPLDHLIKAAADEEVAGLVAFLASDESTYITGEVIRVEGSMAMRPGPPASP
jgi:NAD(P)-dependent dehydrogenase (short-subunit alcohol dehydrogenase family)